MPCLLTPARYHRRRRDRHKCVFLVICEPLWTAGLTYILLQTHGVSTGEVVRGTSIPSGSLPCPGSSSYPLFPHQKHQDLGSTCFQTLTNHQDISASLRRASYAMSARKGFDGGLSSDRAQSYHNSQPSSSTLTLDDPPPFLLDNDPFANLTVLSPPYCIDRKPARSSTPVQPITVATNALIAPRSPLSPPNSATSSYFGAVQTTPPRARSLGKFKPAYERPAFSSPPSLPSLDTLARMSIPPPRKVWYRTLFRLLVALTILYYKRFAEAEWVHDCPLSRGKEQNPKKREY